MQYLLAGPVCFLLILNLIALVKLLKNREKELKELQDFNQELKDRINGRNNK